MILPQACPVFKTVCKQNCGKESISARVGQIHVDLYLSTWTWEKCGSMWINVDQCGLMWINTIQYTYFMKPFTDRYILFVS